MEENTKANKKSIKEWWKGLEKPTKIVLCSVTSVALASAIIFPTLAATIWKDKFKGEEITFTKDDYYYAENVSLKKGHRYVFTVTMSELESYSSQMSVFSIDYMQEHNSKTIVGDVVTDIAIKSNKTVFTQVSNIDNLSKHQYCFYTNEDGTFYPIGKESFSEEEKDLTIAFTSKDDFNNLILYVGVSNPEFK